ncbi:MAG TPA: PhoU domain-containing protein [Anaerolineales bacterium]|nr:PhoU domain-containing protein [Anaerolineales bacterium]
MTEHGNRKTLDRQTKRLLDEILVLGSMVEQAVLQAVAALKKRDLAAARSIPDLDDEVDRLYNRINRELIKRVGQEPSSIDTANYLMWASHNLERLADRVTNICERTVFIATGEMIEFGKHLRVYKSG